MGSQTNIAWCDKTFNPWVGCSKISPACDNCYAEKWAKRSGSVMWGEDRKRTSKANWKQPLKWDREAKEKGIRYKVFCASLADVFDNQVPTSWRMDLFELIAATPNLDWLILTKRIGNVQKMSTYDGQMFDVIADRVWLGVTVCNQLEVDRDIPKLLAIPSARKFLSIEPMLGPITLNQYLNADYNPFTKAIRKDKPFDQYGCIDWIIVGGETGANARPMFLSWVSRINGQCKQNNVAFFFKQWGEFIDINFLPDLMSAEDYTKGHEQGKYYTARSVNGEIVARIGKDKTGHLLFYEVCQKFPK